MLHSKVAFQSWWAACKNVRYKVALKAAANVGKQHGSFEFFAGFVQKNTLALRQIDACPITHNIHKAPLDAGSDAI